MANAAKEVNTTKLLKKNVILKVENFLDGSGDKGYKKFILFLIIIDLICFTSLITDNFFGWKLTNYSEFIWIFLFALGLIVIANIKNIKKIKKEGFKSTYFAGIVTLIIGILALITAFLSLPFLNFNYPILRSIKGIIGIIAIVYIILQAWVVKEY